MFYNRMQRLANIINLVSALSWLLRLVQIPKKSAKHIQQEKIFMAVNMLERRKNDVVNVISCSKPALCCVWEEHNGKRNDEMLPQLLKSGTSCTPQTKLCSTEIRQIPFM